MKLHAHKKINGPLGFVKKFWRDTTAAIALMFAIMAPLLIGAAGMSVDFANAYLVQQRLAQAIDAAALAATAYSTDSSEIEAKVEDFFNANYPFEKMGLTFTPEVSIDGNLVTVTANAEYDTFFLGVIGVEYIDVAAKTVVQRDIQGIEVVLVLDNTGSMSYNNNIGKLRTASCEFIEIIFGTYNSEETSDCLDRYDSFVVPNNQYVKVGLVPFATSVNVGPYGLGYDDDGNSYGASFLRNPVGLTFSNDGDTDICVREYDDGTDVTDNEGPWYMYRWCRNKNDDSAECDKLQKHYVCYNWNSSGTCTHAYYSYGAPREVGRIPEYICPKAAVLPMTNDMTDLKNRIGEMRANGNTYGSTGMVWGYRMISPGFPFQEAVPYENTGYRKVVVMMTDGNNVSSYPYSAYGNYFENNVDSSGDVDDRLRDTCQNMDVQDNITIYTITFEASSGGISDNTKQLYEDCAVNGGRHEHVTSSDELIEVFRDIAQELSNLRIRS